MHMISVCPVEVVPETDEEKLVRFETSLLHDLSELKHRQVIHPVLQEGQFKHSHIGIPYEIIYFPRWLIHFWTYVLVGLKLSSVDPTQSIDLQYLGVPLPLPSPTRQEQSSVTTSDGMFDSLACACMILVAFLPDAKCTSFQHHINACCVFCVKLGYRYRDLIDTIRE